MVFCKPVMGYGYGLLLLVAITWKVARNSDLRLVQLVLQLLPSAVTALVLFVVSCLAYSLPVSFHLLLPIAGARAYRTEHYGFFAGVGRSFWYFPGVHVAYYFGTVRAFWFAATLGLTLSSICAALRLVRRTPVGESLERNYEIVLSCGLLHVAFITLFFGNAFTWPYYVALPVMGIAAASSWNSSTTRAAWVLVFLALVGHKSMLVESYHSWLEDTSGPQTAGLWASAAECQEWGHIQDLVRGRESVLLQAYGGAALLFSEFQKPVAAYLYVGQPSPNEVRRQLRQLSQASVAVVSTTGSSASFFYLEPSPEGEPMFLEAWPLFAAALSGWQVSWRGKLAVVYQRPGYKSGPPAEAMDANSAVAGPRTTPTD